MERTGIVRRIDELGRVVIPKEIRRTMRIKEGEELEISVLDEDTLSLKKYSTPKAFFLVAQEYTQILYKYLNYNCLICDNDVIVACSKNKDIFLNKSISKRTENFLKGRKSGYFRGEENFPIIKNGANVNSILVPLILNGDCIGGLIVIDVNSVSIAEKVIKALEISAELFLKRVS